MNGKKLLMNQNGFSLVEVMVAVTILPILFFSVYSLLNMAQVITSTNDVFARLNQSQAQMFRNMTRELAQTSATATPARLLINTDANGNSDIRFQIPVDWDNDGDAIGNGVNNPVEWGAYEEVGHTIADPGLATQRPELLNEVIRYYVRDDPTNPNLRQLVREVLDDGLNGANVVNGTTRVIASNISVVNGAFTVTPPVNNIIRTSLTLRGVDVQGQIGSTRTFSDNTFICDTMLRIT